MAIIWPDASCRRSIAKEEMYTVEGITADRKMYLGRQKRRSRCISHPRRISRAQAFRGTTPGPFPEWEGERAVAALRRMGNIVIFPEYAPLPCKEGAGG